MKHLKIYENNDGKKYWLMPTDERFLDSLDKISCNDPDFFGGSSHEFKYIFAIYLPESYSNNIGEWGWERYRGELTCEWAEERNYEFQGIINIKEGELEADKYNL